MLLKLITLKNFKKAIKDPLSAILIVLWIKRHFSQTWEDLILNWLLRDKKKGFYIDIGANHPTRTNNTYLFYKKWWNWINIEPDGFMIKKFFTKRKRDKNLKIGIGKKNWEIIFYVFEDSQLSTCDKETVSRYKKAWYKVLNEVKIPIRTLEKLCDRYVKNKQIDILSIDVEGRDMDVLEWNNRYKYKPKYIILETVEYAKKWKKTWTKENYIFDPYLKSKWYFVVAETGINTIYKLSSK